MIKKITLSAVVVILSVFVFEGMFNSIFTNKAGCPVGGYTGSPNDGKDCTYAGCHKDAKRTVSGWITSDIPKEGYTPGQKYTITLTAKSPNQSYFGFEFCASDSLGANVKGKLDFIDISETQIISSIGQNDKKYMTHKLGSYSSSTPGSRSWSFNWTAPTKLEKVFFFCCYVSGLTETTDSTFLEKLEISGKGLNVEDNANNINFNLYPNPVINNININFEVKTNSNVNVSVFDLSGKLVKNLANEKVNNNYYNKNFNLDLSKGNYYINVNVDGSSNLKKIVVL